MQKKLELNLVLYCLWIAIFKFFLLPKEVHQFIKIIAILYIVIFILKNVQIKAKEFKWILLLGILQFLSSLFGYYKGFITINNLIDSILDVTCIYCMFTIVTYAVKNKKTNLVINSLFNILLIYNIINIISVFVIGVDPRSLLIYFLGNKFRTSYYLILFVCIWYMKKQIDNKRINKVLLLLLILFTIGICKHVNCTTALVGSFLLFLLLIDNEKIKSLLSNQKLLTILIISSGFIIVMLDYILTNQSISYFIINILHEDLSLTGRMKIYSYLKIVFYQSPLLGHGYGNYSVGTMVGYGNAQNSVFQYLIDYGICGFLILIITIYKLTKKDRKLKVTNITYPLYIYLFVIIMCATVEIVFNHIFFLVLFLIYNYNHQEELEK